MRIATYLVGLLLGYLLFSKQGKVKFNKLTVFILWAVVIGLTQVVLFGIFNFASTGEITPIASGIYAAFNRTAWGVAVALLIYLCLNGYGGFINQFLSWNVFFPLSRITYCAYLVHEMVLYYLYATAKDPPYGSHYYMVYHFLAALCIAYGLALVISLTFEAPVMQLEKILLDRPRKKQPVKEPTKTSGEVNS